jgi:hypothetical protein
MDVQARQSTPERRTARHTRLGACHGNDTGHWADRQVTPRGAHLDSSTRHDPTTVLYFFFKFYVVKMFRKILF